MKYEYRPKPTRKPKKVRHRLSRYAPIRRKGDRAEKWEWFKQFVVFPLWWAYAWFKSNNPQGVAVPGTITLGCSYKGGCEIKGRLTRLDVPTESGKWWRLEDLQVDHMNPRSNRPDQIFELTNLQPMCEGHNKLKGGSHA